jgi:hypothetical protein
MYQNQANNAAGSQYGDVAGRLSEAPTPVEQPALQLLCERLERQLAAFSEGVTRARNVSHRLLDPRPEKVAKDQAGPTTQPPTVEGRLRAIVRAAESINADLHNVACDLERAA